MQFAKVSLKSKSSIFLWRSINDVTAAQLMVFFKYLETSPRSILYRQNKNTP